MSKTARRAGATPSQRTLDNALPPYEQPQFPLNAQAQRALAQLYQDQRLQKLDDTLEQAQKALSNAAAEINDRVASKSKSARKRRDRLNSNNAESSVASEVEQNLADLERRVAGMTARMDDNMRKLIDGRHRVQSIQTCLNLVTTEAGADASTQFGAQPVRSQRRLRGSVDDDAESADEYQDFQPTDPSTTTPGLTSALQIFRAKLEDAERTYHSYSQNARYATDNEYRDFRVVVHEAKYPDGGVQLAHHSEWFRDGETSTARPTMNEDDLEVLHENTSTKCQLSLQELENPLSSKKCRHTFESKAILDFLAASGRRGNGSGSEQLQVECPVPGCYQVIKESDLFVDTMLLGKIQRMRRAKVLQTAAIAEDVANDGVISMIMSDDDAPDVDDLVDARPTPQMRAKPEPRSSTRAPVSW